MNKYWVTGLLVWIPLAATLWLFSAIIDLLDGLLVLLPDGYHPKEIVGVQFPGMGVILVLSVIFLTGLITTNVFGQKLLVLWQAFLGRIPILNSVYSGIRQISDTLLSPQSRAFRQAVLVPWPNETSYTIGFVTGSPGADLTDFLEGGFVNVYVPSTPNPTSGYYVLVPEHAVTLLDMSVETALRYVVSMGVASAAAKTAVEPNPMKE